MSALGNQLYQFFRENLRNPDQPITAAEVGFIIGEKVVPVFAQMLAERDREVAERERLLDEAERKLEECKKLLAQCRQTIQLLTDSEDGASYLH
jgi:hypothetical protein